jgi:hypothetical protein
VTGRLDFPHGVPADDYQPTPPDAGAELSRKLLDRLLRDGLETLPMAEFGTCHDCKRDHQRIQYGHVVLCRGCARQRRAAVAAEVRGQPTASSSWTGWRRDGKRYVRHPQGVDRPPVTRQLRPSASWEYWRKETAA